MPSSDRRHASTFTKRPFRATESHGRPSHKQVQPLPAGGRREVFAVCRRSPHRLWIHQVTNPFAALGLPEPLTRAVASMGYETPTPIQVKAIPELLKGRDVLAAAQTGTGKTAAFSLPILTKMLEAPAKRTAKHVRALILAPTRELAAQIDENLKAYAANTKLTTALVFGGVGINPQTQALARGVDFLVATPGRLLDHLGQKNVTLEGVEFLVLDEADRMLDMGFIHDIRKILKFLPEKRQTLLFSATFSDEIRDLADSFLKDPVNIEIARNKEAAIIEQEAFTIAKKRKRELLRDLIVDNNWEQVLVFTRMKHTANRLAQQLEKDGIQAAAIHGNKSQSARTKALSGFKDHSVRVLVATDIAARGLDIEGLPHVVNYELPNVAEDYVHRIGRTGRAGHPGHAVSLVSPDEKDYLRAVEKLLKKKITTQEAVGYEGAVPEDIARDDAERDKKRAEELQKMREARRAARQKQESARTAPRKTETKAETTTDASERFTKKVVRRPTLDAAREPREAAPAPRRAPRPAERRGDARRDDRREELRRPRDEAPEGRRTEDRRPRRADDARTSSESRGRRFGEDSRRGPRSERHWEERRRRPDIVSTLVKEDDRRYRRQETTRDDSRFESVSSNLPPGMVLKFRRR